MGGKGRLPQFGFPRSRKQEEERKRLPPAQRLPEARRAEIERRVRERVERA